VSCSQLNFRFARERMICLPRVFSPPCCTGFSFCLDGRMHLSKLLVRKRFKHNSYRNRATGNAVKVDSWNYIKVFLLPLVLCGPVVVASARVRILTTVLGFGSFLSPYRSGSCTIWGWVVQRQNSLDIYKCTYVYTRATRCFLVQHTK
jgi:hypothetical protein